MLARRIVAIVLAAGVATLAAIIPFLGSFLVVQDPLERADVIYVLAGALAERTLEAAELYHGGYAPLVVASDGYLDAATVELQRRGIEIAGDAEQARDILLRLGVPPAAITTMPVHHTSTNHEARSITELATRSGWKRIIVVTSKFHTRRARLAMRRQLEALGVQVIMRASRYDRAEPSRWWRSRVDVRQVLLEVQFLIVYALGLA